MAGLHSDEPEDPMAMAGMSTDLDEGFAREFLSCSICWDMYDDKGRQPKLLACHHTFCKGCLKKTLRNRTLLQCPTCRKESFVTEGVSTLQTNFYVMYMKQKFGDQLSSNHNVCYKHALQPLSFFCKTCVQMVCRDCIVLTHPKAEGHDLQELNEVKAEYASSLEQLRHKVEESIRRRQGHLACLRAELDTMDIVSEVASAEADQLFDQLIEVVNARRQQVKDAVQETHESKHRTVSEQLVETDLQTTQLIAIREQLDDATIKGQLRDIVDAATDGNLQERIETLTSELTLNLGRNYFKFEAGGAEKRIQEAVSSVGEVRDRYKLPSMIEISSNEPVACLPTTMTIKVSTFGSEPLPDYPISVAIVDPSADEIFCHTTDNHDGTYTVSYRPQQPGAHMCTVMFQGHKIVSSCRSQAVLSNNPTKVIGCMGKDEGKLMYPCSLKIDNGNNLYVVDEGNQRIQKFLQDGSVEVIPVGGATKSARTFDCAIDVAAEEIICTKVTVESRKAWANTVQVFGFDGSFKYQFTNTEMKKALYVAVNSAREVIVTDYHLNSLFIYDHQGNLISSVGQQGTSDGEFREPAFVCIGRDDDIIISDCRNSRVQVLDRFGTFKYQIGSKGSGKGELQGPSGVATDQHGNILVTDRVNSRIQVFTYEGLFVCCIDSSGDKLNDPRGLAVSADGHVYVADQKNHCIKQYKYM